MRPRDEMAKADADERVGGSGRKGTLQGRLGASNAVVGTVWWFRGGSRVGSDGICPVEGSVDG